ncbi:MAG: DUF3090 domain-containing protein [Candidatus Rokuibacteriota bacterium]|nr:MAG: DUF3090 domain-containing protein [Candidatus Rokubacteria bacterium]
MSDPKSLRLETPDHFTAGTIGPPGQRVFYLQSRERNTLLTVKVEKEQVRALGDYMAGLLAQLPAPAGARPADLTLLEPISPAFVVGSIAVGYDKDRDRMVVEIEEQQEEEDSTAEAAAARIFITRAQAAAFVERARELMQSGRPLCPMCSQPKDPEGHICPRSNGHAPGHVPAEP